ncbi:hypothetical protein EDD16DRAFT_1663381, partial [Pisolithus croceorrhizus]
TKPTFSPAVLFLISVLAQSLISQLPVVAELASSSCMPSLPLTFCRVVSETSHFRALGVDTSFSCVLKRRSRRCVCNTVPSAQSPVTTQAALPARTLAMAWYEGRTFPQWILGRWREN